MPRKEARHAGVFARQLERMFARAPSKRKKFTRTPSRQLRRARHGGDLTLEERQRQRRAKLEAMSPEQRAELAQQRNDEAWGQHQGVAEERRVKDAAREEARRRALGKKGDVRRTLASINLDKLGQWEQQEAADNALSDEDKTEQVTALIDAAMKGDFAMRKGTDALDRDYYRYWLEGVSPKVLSLFDRAVRKGNAQDTLDAQTAKRAADFDSGRGRSVSGLMQTYSSGTEDAEVAQARQDIEDGIGTEEDIRRVYYYDRRGKHDVGSDLSDIANLFIDNDVFRAIKDNLHSAVSDEVANHVMDAVTLASAADPTGATELVAGTWQALQGVDTALQLIPEHVETQADRDRAERDERMERQEETRTGNVRRLISGGRVCSAATRRGRTCALVSRARHH